MSENKLISRETIPIAEPGEETFGFGVTKEIWQIGDKEKIYWKYSLPNTVQIFGVTRDGLIIAIKEFQPGVGAEYLHLPGGTMEPGETPIQTAIRELKEETGYRADSVELISSILENSGRSDRLIHSVLMRGCKKVTEENEAGIETILVTPNTFWKMLIGYLLTDPEKKHGGGNTLKTAALALHKLKLLQI